MKKIVSFLMCIVLTFGMMAMASGCKGNKEKANTDLLKGQTIRVTGWGDDAKPVAGTESGDLQLEAIAAAEEKYGCKVEFVVMPDLTTQLLTAATTGQVVSEVILQRMHNVINLLMQGDYFWSVEDLGGDPKDQLFNQDTTHYAQFNGKTYGWFYNPTNVNSIMAINKSIVERKGGKMPYDLVEDKKWTFEEWKKIMVLGTDVENGIYGGGRSQATVQTFFHANDTGLYTEKDGVHIANTSDPKLQEVLEFLSNMTLNDKIYEANDGKAWDYCNNTFIDGKYATATIGLWIARDHLPTEMTDEWGLMPIPIGPSATEYKKLDTECKAFCIQKAVNEDYAKALFSFMNEAFAYPLDPIEGMRGHYQSFCPDKESLENLMMMQELPLTVVNEFTQPDLRNYQGNTITGSLVGMATGAKPIRSTLDSITPELQGILDEYYGQSQTSSTK